MLIDTDRDENVVGWMLRYFMMIMVVTVQVYFWYPSSSPEPPVTAPTPKEEDEDVNVDANVERLTSTAVGATAESISNQMIQESSPSSALSTREQKSRMQNEEHSDSLVVVNQDKHTTILKNRNTNTSSTDSDPSSSSRTRTPTQSVTIKATLGMNKSRDDDPVVSGGIISETIGSEMIEKNSSSNNNWRCVCETGFLPAGMLKSLGGAESILRLGTGQCYHKQA